MKRALTLLSFAVLAAAPAGAWNLEQNAPNPFCNIPGEPNWSLTVIQFELDEDGLTQLSVLSEDSTTVVKSLVSGSMAAGLHEVLWDGTTNGAELLPAGDYPYRLEVYTVDGGTLLFEDMKVASIYCAVAAGEESWSGVKPRYRD